MKRITLLLMLLSVSGCAHAASLSISGVAPILNNDAACGATPVTTAGTDSVWCIIRIPGAAIADSVKVQRGQAFTRNYTVPAGIYQVSSYAARVVAGKRYYGCPVSLSIEAVAPPDAPTLNP